MRSPIKISHLQLINKRVYHGISHGHIVRLTSALYNEKLVNSIAELLKKFEKFLDTDIKSSHDI